MMEPPGACRPGHARSRRRRDRRGSVEHPLVPRRKTRCPFRPITPAAPSVNPSFHPGKGSAARCPRWRAGRARTGSRWPRWPAPHRFWCTYTCWGQPRRGPAPCLPAPAAARARLALAARGEPSAFWSFGSRPSSRGGGRRRRGTAQRARRRRLRAPPDHQGVDVLTPPRRRRGSSAPRPGRALRIAADERFILEHRAPRVPATKQVEMWDECGAGRLAEPARFARPSVFTRTASSSDGLNVTNPAQ